MKRLGLGLLLVCACGPTNQEIGATVLVALPIIHLLTALVLGGLWSWWRRFEPSLRFSVPTHLLLAASLGLLALLGGEALDLDLLGTAVWVVGTAYLGLTLVVWRIWFAMRMDGLPFHASPWLAMLLTVVPALALLGSASDDESAFELAVYAWFMFGGLGITPGLVLLASIWELWRKPKRTSASHARAEGAAGPGHEP